ncbi:MAG: hypothetical protein KGY99_01490 [Phycisphaerae bacterium]|nr:hypothetical protein [Phycisphaerae bacterium]
MRWVAFAILAYVAVLLQTTVTGLIRIGGFAFGGIRPDLPATLAVFVALRVRDGTDAMLAALVLGAALDMTVVGGPGGETALGVLPLTYVLGAAVVYYVREALFAERITTQVILALGFALLVHAGWVSAQALLNAGTMTWAAYRAMLLQAVGVAAYTGAVMPLVVAALRRCERWIVPAAPLRRGS